MGIGGRNNRRRRHRVNPDSTLSATAFESRHDPRSCSIRSASDASVLEYDYNFVQDSSPQPRTASTPFHPPVVTEGKMNKERETPGTSCEVRTSPHTECINDKIDRSELLTLKPTSPVHHHRISPSRIPTTDKNGSTFPSLLNPPIELQTQKQLSQVESDEADMEGVVPYSDINEIINNYSSSMFFGPDILNAFDDYEGSGSELEENSNQQDVLPSRSKMIPSAPLTPQQRSDLLQASSLLDTLLKKMTKTSIIAIITIYGQSRYSLLAYKHLVSVMKDHQRMPSASTVRLRLFPYLLEHLTVKFSTSTFPSKLGQVGSVKRVLKPGDTSTYLLEGKSNRAVVIKPSEWARLDLRCYHTFVELACVRTCRCHPARGEKDIRIEWTDHVQKKQKCRTKPVSLWVCKNGVPHQGSIGMTVSLFTFCDQQLPTSVSSLSSIKLYKTMYKKQECNHFEASILCTYVVEHAIHRGMLLTPGMTPTSEDSSYRSIQKCVSYLQRFFLDKKNVNHNQLESSSIAQQQQYGFHFNAGDHLTFLNASEDINNTFIVVFVNRFWPSRLDEDRQFILFVTASHGNDLSHSWIPSFGVPAFVREPCENDRNKDVEEKECMTTGFLSNGRRYYMYRLLLYADDFNPRSALFPRGSVGGVYMSPAGFSIRTRRSQKTIRTISLTPSGVSTNHVLDYIIEDLVSGSLDGFDCFDPFGNKVRFFFDIIGFLADYPASSSVVDVLGHNGSAPCTHCTFVLVRSQLRSRYAFTTTINSSNSMFRRTQWRTVSIRSVGLDSTQSQQLGVKDGDNSTLNDRGRYPLLKLASQFNERLNQHNRITPFNTEYKDGYEMNIVAPDHLLTGLMKGVLYCTFRQLPTDNDRDNLQIMLKACLLEFGFQSQNYFFQNKKLVPGLSMSMIYAIFIVLPPLLESMGQFQIIPTRNLIINLHTFVCIGFWWPSLETDGIQAWEFVHGKGSSLYHNALHRVASNFINSVDRYFKKYPSFGKYVDRPNTHRLLELTTHTLPTYHHLLFICELVFESAHQPLKFLLSRNNTSNSHINSVKVMLVKDWMFRVWCSWVTYNSKDSSEIERKASMNTLMYLFCGSKVDEYDWNFAHLYETKVAIQDHIVEVLTGTVGDILADWYSDTMIDNFKDGTWTVSNVHEINTIPIEKRTVLGYIENDLSMTLSIDRKSFSFVSKVNFQRGFGSTGKNSHEMLRLGDVVQVLLKRPAVSSRFIELSSDGYGKIAYFVIGAIIATEEKCNWLITRQCTSTTTSSSTSQMPDYNHPLINKIKTIPFFDNCSQSANAFSYIRLDRRVRKVGILHNCKEDGGCHFSSSSRTVNHSTTSLDGGHFFVISRSYGYPPRRS